LSPQEDISIWHNELLTIQEVADHFRVSRVTAWRWCKEGIIPAFRIGRRWRIHRDDLLHLQDCLRNDLPEEPSTDLQYEQ